MDDRQLYGRTTQCLLPGPVRDGHSKRPGLICLLFNTGPNSSLLFIALAREADATFLLASMGLGGYSQFHQPSQIVPTLDELKQIITAQENRGLLVGPKLRPSS